jgi:hypothetical protein
MRELSITIIAVLLLTLGAMSASAITTSGSEAPPKYDTISQCSPGDCPCKCEEQKRSCEANCQEGSVEYGNCMANCLAAVKECYEGCSR